MQEQGSGPGYKLGTAHIQSFTQTRQVSVVMGIDLGFWAAIGS